MATPQASPATAPRKSRKTLWIVLGIAGFLVLCVLAFAAFGLYFLTRNLEMQPATMVEAAHAFDEVRARFKEEPIITFDDNERVRLTRPPPGTPAAVKPASMHVMAYDDDDERIVRVTVPFWMLRMGRENIRLGTGDGFDFERLRLSADELERYGPALLVDHRDRRGSRVLVWTE